MITSKDLALAGPASVQHDCVPYAGLRADLGAAGDAERVEVHTAEIRQLLRDYDALRAAQRARLP